MSLLSDWNRSHDRLLSIDSKYIFFNPSKCKQKASTLLSFRRILHWLECFPEKNKLDELIYQLFYNIKKNRYDEWTAIGELTQPHTQRIYSADS